MQGIMKRFLLVLPLLGALGFVTPASATCRWLGSQLECDVGEGQVRLGTQVSEPVYARAFEPHAFLGAGHLFDDRPTSARLRLELQNVTAQPNLCRRFGNEVYCY